MLELLFMSLHLILVHKCWLFFLSVFSSFPCLSGFCGASWNPVPCPCSEQVRHKRVGIVPLSTNFLPQIQRFRWRASSILFADLLMELVLLSRKKIQCFGYTDIWCCCSYWLANGSNFVQLVSLAQREQGQGGTSSSDGYRDGTFVLPNWEGSRSCIHSGL